MDTSMNVLRKTVAIGTVMALSALASPVMSAKDPGWYVGGSYGRSDASFNEWSIRNNLRESGFSTTRFSDDSDDRGYKIFGGYQFNRFLAVESGYYDLGSFNFRADTEPPGSLAGDIEVKGWNLDAVGLLPLGERFSLLGRIGAAYSEADARLQGTGAVTPLNPNSSEQDTDVKFGIGAQWAVTEVIGLRLEAERFHFDDSLDNRADIDLISLGLVMRFGQTSAGSHTASTAAAPQPTRSRPVPVVVPAPRKVNGYCNIVDLQFEINADTIQKHDEEKLQILANYLNQHPDTNAVIEGYSDNVGNSADNMRLSERRAANVVNHLVRSHGIDRSRLSSVGYGEKRPLVSGASEASKRTNRRIGAVIACVTDIEGLEKLPARITMAMQIEFERNSADIGSQYHGGLRKVARFMRHNPTIVATVEGHADNSSPSVSAELSRRRAQNVVNYLARNSGIERSRMTAVGFGETRRYAYNTSSEGRQANRRVNIILEYMNQEGAGF